MADKYTNELFTAFTGKVNSSFTDSIKKVNTELTNLGKSAEGVSKRFRKVDIGKLNSNMAAGAKSANSYSSALGNVGRAIQVIATFQIASNVIGGITQALSTGARAIIDYDQTLHSLKAITGATDGELGLLGETFLRVSNNTKFSINEVGAAAQTLGQAGMSATETVQALGAVASLATGTISDFNTTADLVVSTLNSFDLQATDSSRVADVFASAVNNSRVQLKDLQVILSFVGATAKNTGVSLEETATVVQELRNRGIRTSTAATGLRKTLLGLIAPSKSLKTALDNIGMSADKINPSVVGAREAFLNLGKVLADQETGYISTARATEFFGIRAQQVATIIAEMATSGNFDKVLALTGKMGSAAEQQAEQQKGLGIELKNLADRWTNVAIILGDAGFSDAIRSIISLFSEMALVVQKSAEGYLLLRRAIEEINNNPLTMARRLSEDTAIVEDNVASLKSYATQLRLLKKEKEKGVDTSTSEIRLLREITSRHKEAAEVVALHRNNSEELADALDKKANQALLRQQVIIEKNVKALKAARVPLGKQLERLSEAVRKQQELVGKLRVDDPGSFDLTTQVQEGVLRDTLENLNKAREAYSKNEASIAGFEAALTRLNTSMTKSGQGSAEAAEKVKAVVDKYSKLDALFTRLGLRWQKLREQLESRGDYSGLLTLAKAAEDVEDKAGKAEKTLKLSTEETNEAFTKFAKEGLDKYISGMDKAINKTYILSKAEKNRISELDKLYKGQQDVLKQSTKEDLSTAKAEGEIAKQAVVNKRHNAVQLVQIKQATAAKQLKIELEAAEKSTAIELKKIQDQIALRATFLRTQGGTASSDPRTQELIASQKQALDKLTATQAALRAEYSATQAKLTVDYTAAIKKNPQTFEQAWSNAMTHVKDQSTQDFTDIQGKIEDVADDIGDGLTDSILGFADGTKSASEAFADMAKSILSDIAKMIIKMQIMAAIGAIMGMFTGPSRPSVNRGIYGPTPSGGNLYPGEGRLCHSGGTVGVSSASGISRSMDPSMFINAPRFHSGGEVAAVLEEGEYVQTKEDRLRSADAGAREIRIEIKNESGTPLGASSASTGMSMGEQVIQIVIDGINRNKSGLRTTIASV